MKWSDKKCKILALIITLIYFVIGIDISVGIFSTSFVFPEEMMVLFYPIIFPIYVFAFGGVFALLVLPIILFIIWLFLYAILKFIIGERN